MNLSSIKRSSISILGNITCLVIFLFFIYLLGPCDTEIIGDAIYLPKNNSACYEWLKSSIRPQDILVEVEPNDPRISYEWIHKALSKAPIEIRAEYYQIVYP